MPTMQESSLKLAGAGAVAGAGVVKVDNAAAKRRPKSTKRKKPSDTTTPAGAGPGGVVAALHPGALPPQSRIDGLTTPGAKSDSGVKLETESLGAGDDSGINMSETWQRNGHSADFIRHSLGQLMVTSSKYSGRIVCLSVYLSVIPFWCLLCCTVVIPTLALAFNSTGLRQARGPTYLHGSACGGGVSCGSAGRRPTRRAVTLLVELMSDVTRC